MTYNLHDITDDTLRAGKGFTSKGKGGASNYLGIKWGDSDFGEDDFEVGEISGSLIKDSWGNNAIIIDLSEELLDKFDEIDRAIEKIGNDNKKVLSIPAKCNPQYRPSYFQKKDKDGNLVEGEYSCYIKCTPKTTFERIRAVTQSQVPGEEDEEVATEPIRDYTILKGSSLKIVPVIKFRIFAGKANNELISQVTLKSCLVLESTPYGSKVDYSKNSAAKNFIKNNPGAIKKFEDTLSQLSMKRDDDDEEIGNGESLEGRPAVSRQRAKQSKSVKPAKSRRSPTTNMRNYADDSDEDSM